MIKRAFRGLKAPQIEYELLHDTPVGPRSILPSKTVTLLLPGKYERKDKLTLCAGDSIKTGQKLSPYEDSDDYAISSVTGTIASVAPYTGDFGQSFTTIIIQAAEKEKTDDAFSAACSDSVRNAVTDFLACVPGRPPLDLLARPDKPIHTLVICGMDADLMIATNQHIIKTRIDAVTRGIKILKNAYGIEKAIIALPRDLVSGFGHVGARLIAVDACYPSANHRMIMYKALKQVVPADKNCEDLGVCFISAEAAASIGSAFEKGRIPFTKTITLINKDRKKIMISARIGTPVRDIFKACDVTVNERDRIIFGGPMTGTAVFSENHPVGPDTDAIIVQANKDVTLVSDYPCVNCGECVRLCPANIQVNMLVRFLEAGEYQTAADEYDLHSCIECGLCSFVCESKIPVFQYIRLAKYELAREKAAEAIDDE